MKNLVIVESPAKAKTIKNFLGKDYNVIASKGHIRDLPKSSFGIKIENENFIPQYRVSKDHSELVKEIKKLAKDSDEIYLATDEDREGEAIAFHIAHAIGKEPLSLPRIVFHEITKGAIFNAIENPRKLDMDSVNAQQARRLLDRIVGYKLSPLLSQKIQRGLSAGRVQSSALKIIVDKEREIQAFVPVQYFSIDAKFKKDLDVSLVEFDSQKIEKLTITNEDRAKFIEETIKNEEFVVEDIVSKERKQNPQPPFMTSSLQQASSNLLGFSPKKTMALAQRLYEGIEIDGGMNGLITYMRTDSLNLSKEAINAARKFIQDNFNDNYLPSKANFYATKSKGAQEAHEAIRPTNINFTPELASKYLDKDLLKLYTLIYNRFLACQMTPSISQNQSVMISSKSAKFKLSGRKLLFDGFSKIYGSNDKDKILPNLNIADKMELQELKYSEHFTEPPARFSEAGLVKKLESLGIGRPSTYAPTISLLTSRNYVKIEKKQLIPEEIAFKIIKVLEDFFSDIVDADFTSNMEAKLDQIAEEKADWQKILNEFYHPFIEKIEIGKEKIPSQKISIPIGEKCPECGGELVKRKGRFGEFIACSTYPKCKYSRNLNDNENGEKAPKKQAKEIGVKCPECGGEIVERISRRGKFYGCSNYPKCKFTSTYEPSGKTCPTCSEMMVIKRLKKGTFLECPKCKVKHEFDENK